MIEVTPADYEVLKRWLASAGEDLEQSADEMTLAGAVSAMIRATAADHVVNDVVLALMRAEQSGNRPVLRAMGLMQAQGNGRRR